MKKNTHKRKSVSPIYAFGLTWLVYSLFFRLSGFAALVKCALLAWLIAVLVKGIIGNEKTAKDADSTQETAQSETHVKEKSKPVKPSAAQTEVSEFDVIVSEGRNAVMKIQSLNDEIPDYKISAQLKQIEILSDAIWDQVEHKKDKMHQIKQFNEYYLPTTIKLLERYVELQNVGLKGENISSAMKQIEDMLDKVIFAFQKQLDDLFERDVIDITADIQVMEQIMAMQGLSDRKDF